jgi:tripartite-type tricarboxylate transporter receptor subunit TctC
MPIRGMKRRAFIAALGGAAASVSAGIATAEDWPTRPVTLVVPYAAGSASDIAARSLAPRLSEVLGQQVIIEDIGGAGGMTASARVAKAAPDFYQFVIGNAGSHAQNQTLYKHPMYNAATDFAPVGLIATNSYALIVNKGFPANNLREFVAYAKANQAKMQYGSAGAGSGIHLACVLLNAAIGVDVTHIPYRGSPAAVQDLIGGRIDYLCPIIGSVVPLIESGTVRALAVLSKDRSAILPDVASAHEQGLTDFTVDGWWAFFMPKGTPAAIVQKLHDATVVTMDTPSVQERMKQIGADLVASERRSPEYLQKFVESEIEKWAAPIKASGVSTE